MITTIVLLIIVIIINNNSNNKDNCFLKQWIFSSTNNIYNVKQIYNWLKYSAGILYFTYRRHASYCEKFKKLFMAGTNDMLWHYFQCKLFYQVFRDFLAWYPGCACTFVLGSMSPTTITFCSQYRENFPNTVT